MEKITIELQKNSGGIVTVTIGGAVNNLSFMHFLVEVLERTIPVAIESAKDGYEVYKEEQQTNQPFKTKTH